MATLSRLAFAFGAPAIIMAGALSVAWLSTTRFDTVMGPSRPILFTPPSAPPSAGGFDVVPPPPPPPNADEAVPAWQAQARNASIPYSPAPRLSPARFAAAWDKEEPARALQCLTSAVYYEAAGEPDAGKRAVAQVVVNRWANRLFPKTICDVVDQGAFAPGCQFSFMCDGALVRRPSPKAWADAEAIAKAALAGYVETSVGAATHYHADYVVPVWAPTMIKLIKLGRHIFYRWPGAAAYMGEPRPDPSAPSATTSSAAALPPAPAALRDTSGLTVATGPASMSAEAPAPGLHRDVLAGATVPALKPQTAPVVAVPSLQPLPAPNPAPARRPVPPPSLRVGPV